MKALATVFLLAAFLITGLAFAGTTGKISGVVTDARTGEKLVAANVVVEGTKLGASTSVDGFYAILNVPPGTYRVTANLMGYKGATTTNVRVIVDQTTTVDFRVTEEAVQAEEVIIVAERPVVQRDLSASRATVTGAEVQNLPVATVASAVGLQAGVQTTGDGKFVIRGGSSDQTAVLLNGLSLRDARDNTPYSGIAMTAVEDVQVQTGGFSAEYGNVRSGVVNIVTKEGSTQRYNFTGLGRYSPVAQKHFGAGPNDPNSFWLRPYLDDEVAWTGTTRGSWDIYQRRQYQEFADGWNEVARKTLQNNNPADPSTYLDDLTPEAAQQLFLFQHRKVAAVTNPDYDYDMSLNGPVPVVSEDLGNLRFNISYRNLRNMYMIPLSEDAYKDQSGQLKLTSDVGEGMKLNFEGLISQSSGTNNSNTGAPGLFTTPGSIATAMEKTLGSYGDARIFAYDYWAPSLIDRYMLGARLSQVISDRSFYSTSLHWYKTLYRTNPRRMRDTRKLYKFGDNYFVDEAPYWFPDPTAVTAGIGSRMNMNLGWSGSRDRSQLWYIDFRFDYTAQLDRYNQLQAGLEFIYTNNRVDYQQLDLRLPDNNTVSQWETNPTQGALYVKDKLEFEGMIADIGLRVDYSNPGGEWFPEDPFNPIFGTRGAVDSVASYQTDPVETQLYFSPRLGVSFPIAEQSKVYFNYGHFRTLPSPDDLYLVRYATADGTITRLANPNAVLPRTIQYELGYEQGLWDQFLLRVAGYYKDVTNETRTVQYVGDQNLGNNSNYVWSLPNNYQDVRGAEITLAKNRGDWIQGFVNYTYEVVSRGFFGKNIYYENRSQQTAEDLLNEYQVKPTPQPYARANIDFFTPSWLGDEGVENLLLSEWRVNLVAGWVSGSWFSWAGGASDPNIQYNVQWTDSWSTNLRLSKNFRFGPLNLQFFMDVNNLFNLQQMGFDRGFTSIDDYNDYMKSLHLPEEIAGTPTRQPFGYANFSGDDKAGMYREPGVEFRPFVAVADVNNVTSPVGRAVYFDIPTGRYMKNTGGGWEQLSQSELDGLIDNKAYIDNPNQLYFGLLNPRDIYYGLRVSFDL